MDGITFCFILFVGFCIGIFNLGGWDANNIVHKACLNKNEIVIKDVRFNCVPKAILINGKEVEYK